EDYYDFIAPQYYNQGGDGIWVDELNAWITQNNDDQKLEFLYYLTDSLINGTRGFSEIPADRLVIGLPSNNDGAATGYVINPQDVNDALAELQSDGNPIRGLMTWSINWDDGKDKEKEPYNWEFMTRYGYLTGGTPTPDKPPAPENLRLANPSAVSETSIDLVWNAPEYSVPVLNFTLYRNGEKLDVPIDHPSFTDKGLTAGTTYRYQVSGFIIKDSQKIHSDLSRELEVTTQGEGGGDQTPEWNANVNYKAGDQVRYQATVYTCVTAHSSREDLKPDVVLWQ
ncbi:carbohydrate-binding protein, partial [Pseudomonas viridiflava]